MPEFPPLEVTPIWARLNDELIELVDRIPERQLDWSPKPELWNFKGIMLHVIVGRHGLTAGIVQDGGRTPEVLKEGQTPDGLKEQFRVSWRRMERFLADPEALAREYEVPFEGETRSLNGHWLAFGLLEHDIHHRADIIHYLGMLGIAHPEPDSIERKFREG